jgi:hypothetical protein
MLQHIRGGTSVSELYVCQPIFISLIRLNLYTSRVKAAALS